MTARYTLHARRIGTVHIVRWWEVRCDGHPIDQYESRELALAYVNYKNTREEASANAHR